MIAKKIFTRLTREKVDIFWRKFNFYIISNEHQQQTALAAHL
tara:strand:- start:349 stop:474 length:126 start_codon:yes stop_codon:yes gene_type:complete